MHSFEPSSAWWIDVGPYQPGIKIRTGLKRKIKKGKTRGDPVKNSVVIC
jgi:hypothetical protein